MVHVARDRATSILKEFRGFILRGNVVDLAVAVFVGKDFAKLAFEINGSQFQYGLFINALITFLITAAAVFFLVVKPLHALMVRLEMVPAEPMPSSECPSCLTEIPTASKRCRACTSELEVGWAGPES